ncbi:MAG TPA: hypothetical protein VLC92_09705 [Rhodocyclaceae bacterium]|nr:hypothetical protein [Rhodocyclaceae bacterium]
MDKDGKGFALWLPGTAVVLSLLAAGVALQRTPMQGSRPIGAEFSSGQQKIDARLWQDPYEAVERFRKISGVKPGNSNTQPCQPYLGALQNAPQSEPEGEPQGVADQHTTSDKWQVLVVTVPGGPSAVEVESRRRVRYAILAGLNNTGRVPEDEDHISCLTLGTDKVGQEIPYETFIANQLPGAEPATAIRSERKSSTRLALLWVREEVLRDTPIAHLEQLRIAACGKRGTPSKCTPVMKVIGPAYSSTLLAMRSEVASPKVVKPEVAGKSGDVDYATIEIYSPFASAEDALLAPARSLQSAPAAVEEAGKPELRLLRTASDDRMLAKIMIGELARRGVAPASKVACRLDEQKCAKGGGWARNNRVAIISEWDSFYSRALLHSFKEEVTQQTGWCEPQEPNCKARAVVDDYVLNYSYLRGLDGRLASDAAAKQDDSDKDSKSSGSSAFDKGAPERTDGTAQLDYLRRLTDRIADADSALRTRGEDGIGAIGVLGNDAYDKLLVVQALKQRMPDKLFFSTDLDVRMLQRDQALYSRNLILASPYGLTVTPSLQKDVPPFRDSLQSAAFVALQIALDENDFEFKRGRLAVPGGSRSTVRASLFPGIYEVGRSGFVPLPIGNVWPPVTKAQGVLDLAAYQEPPPDPFPAFSKGSQQMVAGILDYFHIGWLVMVVGCLALLIGWYNTLVCQGSSLPTWVRMLPMLVGLAAAMCVWLSVSYMQVEPMWLACILVALGLTATRLISVRESKTEQRNQQHLVSWAPAWYVITPVTIFLLVVLMVYQNREFWTDHGQGEPMFLFEGISAWPGLALRFIALLISLFSLAWGWSRLRDNKQQIMAEFGLKEATGNNLLFGLCRIARGQARIGNKRVKALGKRIEALAKLLRDTLFPFNENSIAELDSPLKQGEDPGKFRGGLRPKISVHRFWSVHCYSGSFFARLLRAALLTWMFSLLSSLLFVIWPLESSPIRGSVKHFMPIMTWAFWAGQLLVFWVVDANIILVRFINTFIRVHTVWPASLQAEHERMFGVRKHPCVDDWVDLRLIARRTEAVNMLIYAPVIVLIVQLLSRSDLFDNWATPPSIVITQAVSVLILFLAALGLRRTAERARSSAIVRIDEYLLSKSTIENTTFLKQLQTMREQILKLNNGAFSPYSEQPMVKAIMMSLTGIGGTAIANVLSLAKF